jgi:hypothetical protein
MVCLPKTYTRTATGSDSQFAWQSTSHNARYMAIDCGTPRQQIPTSQIDTSAQLSIAKPWPSQRAIHFERWAFEPTCRFGQQGDSVETAAGLGREPLEMRPVALSVDWAGNVHAVGGSIASRWSAAILPFLG